ncbi:hypothetical protein [Nocardia terpenica]|uniref:hypothetical protein n=1 Tax=Nocardia terpenica TaxID=455432 RepID=UPI0012E770D1|nr:hypothetical protein [Nocardia terpenica]NQE89036.1 hypothetical protein [Nocardia terpenica]
MPDQSAQRADELTLRIAVAGVLGTAATDVFRTGKAEFAQSHLSGERRIVTSHRRDSNGDPIRLGAVSVVEGSTSVMVTDPAAVVAWLRDNYNADPEEALEMVPQLTRQWMKTVEQAAKAAATAGKPLPPGIAVHVGDPHARFERQKDVDAVAEVAAMIRDKVLDLTAVLALPAAPPASAEETP